MMIYKTIQKKTVVKRRYFWLLSLLFLLILCRCKPDFSINSNSEPFPVVYGLLNATDEQHYVKIFKSFVVEGNAYDAVHDINNYSYIDSIDVYLVEYQQGNIVRYRMDTTTSIAKNPGLFSYPTQILYTVKASLNKDYLYGIEVINPYTENVARVKEPIAVMGKVDILRPSLPEITITDDKMSFAFYTVDNANMYQVLLKFYYTEDFLDGTKHQPEPVVWDLGSIDHPTETAGSIKDFTVSSGASFFQNIASKISINENVTARHTDSIVMEIYAAGKDWGLYIKSNQPSSGINQNRLIYTNMTAYNQRTGEQKYTTGLFSVRGITTKKFDDLATNKGSRDSLFHGRYTGHLKFIY